MNRDILCYHGTSLANAEIIKSSKAYKFGSRRDDHWLGFGVYFFEEDIEQAKLWGKERYKHECTATLETIITAERSKILNLNSRQGIIELEAYQKAFIKENPDIVIEYNEEMPIKPLLANLLFSSISSEEVWVIIRYFPVASRFDKNNNIQNLGFNHNGKQVDYNQYSPQVCVKKLDAIVTESIRIVDIAQPKITKRNKKPVVKKGSLNYDAFSK